MLICKHISRYTVFLVTLFAVIQNLQAFQNQDLLKTIEDSIPQTNEANCKQQNLLITKQLETLIFPQKLNEITVDQTNDIVEKLWTAQLALKTQQNKINRNLNNLNCPFQTYETLLRIRENLNFFSKVRAQQLANNRLINLKKSKRLFSYPKYQIFKNSQFKFESLKDLNSGDVMLTRSNAEPMTYYSLQGDHYQPLTHATMIYKNSEGLIYLIESTSLGLTTKRLDNMANDDEFWTREIVNIVIYRNQNVELAQRAAEILYEIATNYTKDSGDPKDYKNNLPYRAGMDVETVDVITNKAYFKKEFLIKQEDRRFNIGFSCIEAIRTAYRLAGDELQIGPYLVPFFKDYSRVDYLAFQKNMEGQLTTPISFFDIDYRFDLVAEWKNINELSDVTDRDRALESVYSWVFKKNYKITEPSQFIKFVVQTVFFGTTLYNVTRFLGFTTFAADLASVQRFPINLIKILENSYWALDPVKKFVEQFQEERSRKYLLPLSPQQLRSEIENERERDLQRWENCESSRFHDHVQPKEKRKCAKL